MDVDGSEGTMTAAVCDNKTRKNARTKQNKKCVNPKPESKTKPKNRLNGASSSPTFVTRWRWRPNGSGTPNARARTRSTTDTPPPHRPNTATPGADAWSFASGGSRTRTRLESRSKRRLHFTRKLFDYKCQVQDYETRRQRPWTRHTCLIQSWNVCVCVLRQICDRRATAAAGRVLESRQGWRNLGFLVFEHEKTAKTKSSS